MPWPEHLPTTEDCDHGDHENDPYRGRVTKLALPWEILMLEALSSHTATETEVRDGDGEPCEDAREGGEVDKKVEHILRRRLDAKVGEATEEPGKDDGDVRHARSVRTAEDARRVTL